MALARSSFQVCGRLFLAQFNCVCREVDRTADTQGGRQFGDRKEIGNKVSYTAQRLLDAAAIERGGSWLTCQLPLGLLVISRLTET